MKKNLLKFIAAGLFINPGILYASIDDIPAEDGFSGYIALGAGFIRGRSNMVAGNSMGDVGEKTITSLYDSANYETDSIPIANAELAYTFADARTQIYAGNKLEDFVEFDFTSLVGVRHQLSDNSLIAASYVFSGLPAEVWEDPYSLNQRRAKTDRTTSGLRLEWDKMMGTAFGVEYSYREIDIDDERSAYSLLSLTPYERSLLDRNGSIQDFKTNYNYNFHNGHYLKPEIRYSYRKYDGRAMRNDAWILGLTHTYNTEKYFFITVIDWTITSFDKSNPIYSKTRDDDRWGIGVSAGYKNIFGLKNWNLLANIAYYDIDSNIDFYDSTFKFAGISAVYRF